MTVDLRTTPPSVFLGMLPRLMGEQVQEHLVLIGCTNNQPSIVMGVPLPEQNETLLDMHLEGFNFLVKEGCDSAVVLCYTNKPFGTYRSLVLAVEGVAGFTAKLLQKDFKVWDVLEVSDTHFLSVYAHECDCGEEHPPVAIDFQ